MPATHARAHDRVDPHADLGHRAARCLLSGIIATHWGLASAFWIGAIGEALGVLLLVFSPLWRLRKVPDPQWLIDEEAQTA